MKRRNHNIKETIISLSIIIIITYYTSGIDTVWKFLCNLVEAMWGVLCIYNQVILGIAGNSVLALVFKSSITFFAVGIILEAFNLPKGKIGHYLGKGLFWLVGLPVSLILNLLGSLLFNFC